VSLYSTLDGKALYSLDNAYCAAGYMRSYFCNGGVTIVSLNSSDDSLRYFDTSTGEHQASVRLWPEASTPGLYG